MTMKHLTPNEFYRQVSKWVGGHQKWVSQKWCNAIVEVIIQECFFKKACRVPLLGVFELVHQKESTQKHIIDGEEKILTLPDRYSIKFTPCDSFVNDVNGKGVTKAYRQRDGYGKLTKRDIERQLRFEKEKVDEYFKEQADIKEQLKLEAQQKREENKKPPKPKYKKKRG